MGQRGQVVKCISFSWQEIWIRKQCWVTDAMAYVWCCSFKLSVRPYHHIFFKPTFQIFLALLVMRPLGRAATRTGQPQQDSRGLYCEGWATAPAPIMPGIRWCHFIFPSTQDISPFNSPSSLFSAFMTLNIYIFHSLPVTLFTAYPEQSYFELTYLSWRYRLIYTRQLFVWHCAALRAGFHHKAYTSLGKPCGQELLWLLKGTPKNLARIESRLLPSTSALYGPEVPSVLMYLQMLLNFCTDSMATG